MEWAGGVAKMDVEPPPRPLPPTERELERKARQVSRRGRLSLFLRVRSMFPGFDDLSVCDQLHTVLEPHGNMTSKYFFSLIE